MVYHVTFDRVEIIELKSATRTHDAHEEEDERPSTPLWYEDDYSSSCCCSCSEGSDDEVVRRRVENIDFYETCRDIDAIRNKLKSRKSSATTTRKGRRSTRGRQSLSPPRNPLINFQSGVSVELHRRPQSSSPVLERKPSTIWTLDSTQHKSSSSQSKSSSTGAPAKIEEEGGHHRPRSGGVEKIRSQSFSSTMLRYHNKQMPPELLNMGKSLLIA